MPKLNRLKKIVGKAKDLRERHRERHRPTGFGFALADSIEYLDPARWDELTAPASVFLSRRYLQVLESAGPDNLQQRYALIFRGRTPVAALAAQTVLISAARLPATSSKTASASLRRIEERMLVCGNLLSWGFHGLAFAPGEDRYQLWAAAAEAVYKIRRADRLFGNTDLVMIKDVPDDCAFGSETLSRYSYRALETEPNMVLDLSPAWRTYEDYLGSLTSNYRKAARKTMKDAEAAGLRVEALDGPDEIERNAGRLHSLYLQVHERQKLRLVTLSPAFIPTLAATFGEALRCTVVRRDEAIVGFVTTLRDGETAVGYYIGFDREANAEAPVYFRLLQAVIEDGLKLGCRRISLGRTALEPKARLGARPTPMCVWIRHRVPAINLIVRSLLQSIPHDEAPARNPFK